jgi:hypothetical protein
MAKSLERHWVRVIRSGHVIEVWRYEIPVWTGFESQGGRRAGCNDGRYRATVMYRAREKIRRLVNANFDNHSKFITLTFRDNVEDLEEANRAFKQFVQRLRRRYGAFRYVAVIEFQQRGAVHYHMMSNLPYIPKVRLAQIWGRGFVRINDVTSVDNVGAYLVKYMTKDAKDPRLRGRKCFLTSRGLVQPEVKRGIEARGLLRAVAGQKVVFSRRYTTEHCGETTYEEYNLRRQSDVSGDISRDVVAPGRGR